MARPSSLLPSPRGPAVGRWIEEMSKWHRELLGFFRVQRIRHEDQDPQSRRRSHEQDPFKRTPRNADPVYCASIGSVKQRTTPRLTHWSPIVGGIFEF